MFLFFNNRMGLCGIATSQPLVTVILLVSCGGMHFPSE